MLPYGADWKGHERLISCLKNAHQLAYIMHSRAKYKPTGLLLVEVVLVVLAAEAHVTVVATAAAA